MNAYFFNLTREEKENILDKHKHVYDGFVTQYAKPKEQPLFVQDFANDKEGITVNNRGEVGQYKNVGINEGSFKPPVVSTNEDIMSGAKFEPEENIETKELDEFLDMIGDGADDLPHGTVDVDSEEKFDDIEDINLLMLDIEEEIEEPLQEQVNKTLDMFRRFKNY